MALQIIKQENQAKGAFAGGSILENKPIGFPQDGGKLKPYSNLFYWANAWSDKGGLIDRHPHKFFEIMSFVLEGEIEHYDNKYERWLPLKKGDAQIIRAGNGIVHAEKINENSRMFQIWFDPNIQKTMEQPASYDDYKSEDMSYFEQEGIKYKNYTGNGGPIKMDAEGLEINEMTIPVGNYELHLDAEKYHSYYLIDGLIKVEENEINSDDYFIVDDQEKISINVSKEAKLFVIASPKKLSYKVYSELVRF